MSQKSLVLRLYVCKGCNRTAAKSEVSLDLKYPGCEPGIRKDREVGGGVGVPALSVITNEGKLINNKQNISRTSVNESRIKAEIIKRMLTKQTIIN